MAAESFDPDFANLVRADRTKAQGLSGTDLHQTTPVEDDPVAGEAFHHAEQDAAGTTWEPNWEPIDTYPDGAVVVLDDGDRQMLGKREMGLWIELVSGDALPQPDFQPMLWSFAPEQVKSDMLSHRQTPSLPRDDG